MNNLKKNLPLVLMMIICFIFINRLFKPKQNSISQQAIVYKSGVVNEKIIIDNSSFFSKILNSFKNNKNTVKNSEIKDIVSVTIDNNKVTNIELNEPLLILEHEAEYKKFASDLVNNPNPVIPDTIKNGAKIIASTVDKAKIKAENYAKPFSQKIKPGYFYSITKNDEKYMETRVTLDPSLKEIVVMQENMSESEKAEIVEAMTTLINVRDLDATKITGSSSAILAFKEGFENVQLENHIDPKSPTERPKSWFWFQWLKNIIAKVILGIHYVVGNYGITIIIVTFLLKIILLPLTLKQDKSMKKMKVLQPEMNKIKEQYKNNPQLMNQKTMELYKKHKINPAGGCLPLLIQMPILIALYGVIRSGLIPETGEVIHFTVKNASGVVDVLKTVLSGPKFLWLDLVNSDPYYILPIVTMIVTYLQQKMMSSTSGDNPMMKNMGIIMPLMMGYISLKLPGGVQLYWLISTVLGIVQQYFIMKRGENND